MGGTTDNYGPIRGFKSSRLVIAMDSTVPIQRAVQEAEYKFPYHYLDLESDRHRLIDFVPVMSRYELVRDRLGDVSGMAILDAGCGDGRFCYEWRDSGARLVGVDYSERAIAFARAFVPEAEFHCADVSEMGAHGPFDRAVLIETLEHVPPDEVSGFLRSIANVLRPGGKLIVTVPSKNRPVGRKHYQHFDEATMSQALSGSFDVGEVSGYGRNYDLRLKIRKRLAKMAYPARRGSGWWSRMVTGYAEWFHRHYGEGPVADSRGVIASATRKDVLV